MQRTASSTGRRNSLVTVEEKSTPSGGGFPVETWIPILTTYMQRIELAGAEGFRADQLTARYDLEFEGPYAPDLDPQTVDVPATQRLTDRGRVYNIVSARVIGLFDAIRYGVIAHTGEA